MLSEEISHFKFDFRPSIITYLWVFQEHLVGENYILSREKEELSENLENAESKIKRLQSEIDDLTENQTQASEVTVLKRDKHMLQSKLKGI